MLRWLCGGLVTLLMLTATPVALLTWVNPPASAFMLGAVVSARLAGRSDFQLHHRWIDARHIAPAAGAAVIAAEDQKFTSHWGFDLESMRAAVTAHRAGVRLRGASTITQQVAKNLFLWSGRSWVRKGLEAWFTILIEAMWSKPRILEVYLNIAQFGDGIYGVAAATERFFGKGPAALTVPEAALLAAVLPNPLRLRVDAPSAYVRQRQTWILTQMQRRGDGVALRQ